MLLEAHDSGDGHAILGNSRASSRVSNLVAGRVFRLASQDLERVDGVVTDSSDSRLSRLRRSASPVTQQCPSADLPCLVICP